MSVHFRKGVMHDMKPVIDRWTTLEKGLMMLFQRNFKDYADFRAVSNLKMYKPSMDPSIFAQKIGKTPEICEVYWKNEYVCDVSIFDSPADAVTKINDGMIELISRTKGVKT